MVAMMVALVTVGGTMEPDTSAMAMVAGSHDDGSGGDRFAWWSTSAEIASKECDFDVATRWDDPIFSVLVAWNSDEVATTYGDSVTP
jgi:hypothetical protein